MSPRSVVALVAVLFLLSAGVAPAAAIGGSTSASVGPDRTGAADLRAPRNDSLDPGAVSMRVELDPDGDARWYVKTAVAVRTDDERAAFEDLVREFNRSESPLGLDAFRAAAENASAATGREMTVRNIGRHHALHNETGTLWISFTWKNFARVSGDRLAVGDGFNTTSGTWLSSLSAGERLVVVPPAGYGVTSVPTGSSSAPSTISNGVARWEGPQDFGGRGPWIVYSGDAPTPTPTLTPGTDAGPGPGTATATPTAGGPTTGPGGPPGGDGGGPLSGALPLVVVVVLAGASAAVLAAYMRGDDGGLGALTGTDGGETGTGADAATGTGESAGATDGGDARATVEDGAAGGTTGAAAGAAAGAGAATAEADDEGDDADEATGSPDDEIDEELLSDEERVERLLERNGGRMKQAAIVRETGWSNAKVSQLLSGMDEDDRIDKLRIGRENLISFPDEDVTDIDSE
ncbi:MAG: helix-turn-helix transcriptional regulator [Halosimplex sp.]